MLQQAGQLQRPAPLLMPTAQSHACPSEQKDSPKPTDKDVRVKRYGKATVFVRNFTGFATEVRERWGALDWAQGQAGEQQWSLEAAAASCVLTLALATPKPTPPQGTILDNAHALHEMLKEDDQDFDEEVRRAPAPTALMTCCWFDA